MNLLFSANCQKFNWLSGEIKFDIKSGVSGVRAAYTPPCVEILKNGLSKENGSFHPHMSVNPIDIDNVMYRKISRNFPFSHTTAGGLWGAKWGHF